MGDLGRFFILAGVILLFIGLGMVVFAKFSGISKLPGDISVQSENFHFFFPLTTCILISIVLTVLINLFVKK